MSDGCYTVQTYKEKNSYSPWRVIITTPNGESFCSPDALDPELSTYGTFTFRWTARYYAKLAIRRHKKNIPFDSGYKQEKFCP